jgi:hypothetical protein
MLHAEIAHAKEVDAFGRVGDIGIELLKEGIRIQRRREASLALAWEWRVSSVARRGSEWSESGELKKATTVHEVRKVGD